MPQIKANGINLEYDTFGNDSDRPLLLVMGLGAQMIHWDEDFCDMLADAGHFVIRYDNRVRSMTSIMASTGNPNLPPASPDAQSALTSTSEENEAAVVQRAIEMNAVIGSPGFEFDIERATRKAIAAFNRSFYPAGIARQMAAVAAHGDRRERLNQLSVPTLVIHGTDDCLVPVEGGIDTHENIKDSELMLIEGMGHDLPLGAWKRIVEAVSRLTLSQA